MRIMIDLIPGHATPWAGAIRGSGEAEATPFEGRLALFRALEDRIDAPLVSHGEHETVRWDAPDASRNSGVI